MKKQWGRCVMPTFNTHMTLMAISDMRDVYIQATLEATLEVECPHPVLV